MDETAECCNNFVLVLKPNEKVRLCLDPVKINQMLIRQVQIQEIGVWSSPHIGYVATKIDEIFKYFPNIFDIADDIFVVGYDRNGKEHDNIL